jgi:hypothetical protein
MVANRYFFRSNCKPVQRIAGMDQGVDLKTRDDWHKPPCSGGWLQVRVIAREDTRPTPTSFDFRA